MDSKSNEALGLKLYWEGWGCYFTSFKTNNVSIDLKVASLGIGGARESLNCRVVGDQNPQLYLRTNSVYPLECAIKNRCIIKTLMSSVTISLPALMWQCLNRVPQNSIKSPH